MASKGGGKDQARGRERTPAATASPDVVEATPPPSESDTATPAADAVEASTDPVAPAVAVSIDSPVVLDASLPELQERPLLLGTYEDAVAVPVVPVSSESTGSTPLSTMPGQDVSLIGATGDPVPTDVGGRFRLEVIEDGIELLEGPDAEVTDGGGRFRLEVIEDGIELLEGPDADATGTGDVVLTVGPITEIDDDGGDVVLTVGPITEIDDDGGDVVLTIGPITEIDDADAGTSFDDTEPAGFTPDTVTDVGGYSGTTTDEDGTMTTVTYDEVGRVYSTSVTATDGGVTTTSIYDGEGNLIESTITWPDGETKTFDADGNEVTSSGGAEDGDATDDTDDTGDTDDTDDTTDDTGDTDEEGYTTDESGVSIGAHGDELLDSLNVRTFVPRIGTDPDGPDYEEGGGTTVTTSGSGSLSFNHPFLDPVSDPAETEVDVVGVLDGPASVPINPEGPDVVPLDDSPEPIVLDGPSGGNPIAATLEVELELASPFTGGSDSLLAWSADAPSLASPVDEVSGGGALDGELLHPDDFAG